MKITKFFTDFGVRLVSLLVDLILVLFLMVIIRDFIFTGTVPKLINQLLIPSMIFLYFFLFWASPMKATPVQLIMGMRVVDLQGNQLGYKASSVRAGTLLVALYFITQLGQTQSNKLYLIPFIAGIAVGLVAIFTPNRQGIHDLLSGSIVVNRKALNNEVNRLQIIARVNDNDPKTLPDRRPSILSIIINLIAIAIPLLLLQLSNNVRFQKDLRVRTSYAIYSAKSLKNAISEYYHVEGQWPDKSSKAISPIKHSYPDGGYYQLEDDGVISIHFTVKPLLMKGSLWLTPTIHNEKIIWTCHNKGEIENMYLPSNCRSKQ